MASIDGEPLSETHVAELLASALPFPVLRNGRRCYFSRRAYEAWRDGERDSGNAE